MKKLVFPILLVLAVACKKSNPPGNRTLILGTWRYTACIVDGIPNPGVGTFDEKLTFTADGKMIESQSRPIPPIAEVTNYKFTNDTTIEVTSPLDANFKYTIHIDELTPSTFNFTTGAAPGSVINYKTVR